MKKYLLMDREGVREETYDKNQAAVWQMWVDEGIAARIGGQYQQKLKVIVNEVD